MNNILVVEDDENVRPLLTEILTYKLGLNVAEAKSANEAINLLQQGNKYSLIVSDYNMPNGDGKKLQDYLVDNRDDSPFVFFSSDCKIRSNKAHLHFLGTIAKPNLEKLLSAVSLVCTPEAEIFP